VNWVIEFHPKLLREFEKLDPEIKRQVIARMRSRALEPKIPKAKLRGELKNCYKIKLKNSGYRVVYQVLASQGKIRVLAIGRRDSGIYQHALSRS
jgi:mRNA interferase RelE/StbE